MQIQRIRFCFGGKEADYQWYELRCSTLKDAQGEIMLAGIMQNIQNLVEHEQQLILAKQIAEKIRHQIHHPENCHNEPYTETEIRQSIEDMRAFIMRK